jgi:hypothetical protein
LKKQKEELVASITVDRGKIAHIRKTEGTSIIMANFLFDNNTDEVAIETLKNATGKTGKSFGWS